MGYRLLQGKNENLIHLICCFYLTDDFLTRYIDWKLVHYEAKGNNVTASGLVNCKLMESHPTLLASNNGTGTVEFTLNNGVGYVPISISGLTDYKGWVLEEHKNNAWVSLAKSQETHGNDYWQCVYDPVSGKYTLTFNVYRYSSKDLSTKYRLRKI